jgi:chemotaxis protein MotB
MTAMMAFFLVMWLLSISTPKQREGIAEHFRTPLKVALSGGEKAA